MLVEKCHQQNVQSEFPTFQVDVLYLIYFSSNESPLYISDGMLFFERRGTLAGCGETLRGVLQHPPFKKLSKNLSNPIRPDFSQDSCNRTSKVRKQYLKNTFQQTTYMCCVWKRYSSNIDDHDR